MVKAAAIVQTAEQRTVCVCLFADKKTSFHIIVVTVIYSLVHRSRAVGRSKNLIVQTVEQKTVCVCLFAD